MPLQRPDAARPTRMQAIWSVIAAIPHGRQGDDEIAAEEWAERLDTITYEIVCGFGARLPRMYR